MSLRNSDKNSSQNNAQKNRCKKRLNKNGILDLSQCWFLDPNLAVKDFAHNIPVLVLDDPQLVFIAVLSSKRVKATLVRFLPIILHEKFPRSDMTVVHAMQDNTQALVCSNQSADAQNPRDGGHSTVTAVKLAKSNRDGNGKASNYKKYSKEAGVQDAGGITVAN